MKKEKYIYTFNYPAHHKALSKLESRHIFEQEDQDKLIFSNKKIDPEISAYIKFRFEIIQSSKVYSDLLDKIQAEKIHLEGFKAEYLILEGDPTGYKERLNKLRDVGYRIEGFPDYQKPVIIYALCFYKDVWYFGILKKPNKDWLLHKEKPSSFSNSIEMDVAKSLVGIASKGDKSQLLLDACCGVGTVMLEACFSGYNIEGCDINFKTCKHARKNLDHFNYSAIVHCSDIKDLKGTYNAAIVDLPYNLFSYSDDAITMNILESAAKLSPRLVIVSISDIENIINKLGLKIQDICSVEKRGKTKFSRKIWVCESSQFK